MKIGYPCINLSLACRSSKTFRLASFTEERFLETVKSNLACLLDTLIWNAKHHIQFFRISSQLIPFASHPVCAFPWQQYFRKEFTEIGEFIRTYDVRISMHPDQFVLINSPSETIFENSVRELAYHCDVLDVLGLNESHKVQIHVGGVYGDKQASMKRFIQRYNSIPQHIKKRLVIENDDRLFSVKDCLMIHKETRIPIIFDNFHHALLNNRESNEEALTAIAPTWLQKDGIPMIDYSSQQHGSRVGKHTEHIDMQDFRQFLVEIEKIPVDIMLEIKDKEGSALEAITCII